MVGLMDENRLPAHFEPVWTEFPLVVTGVRTRSPSLSFTCVDHHMVALRAFEKALELGCKRPSLVLDQKIDAVPSRPSEEMTKTLESSLCRGEGCNSV